MTSNFYDYSLVVSGDTKERFMSRCKPVASGCWQWMGAWSFGIDYRQHKPHRVAYGLFCDPIIGEGNSIHRRCRNLRCVNPDHLFEGPKALPVELRLEWFTDKTPGHGPDGDCHVWTGHINKGGYGSISLPDGRTSTAHRVAYEVHHGPVPEGHFVLHRCDHRSCVNPDHLYSGTHQQNMDDRTARKGNYIGRGQNHHASVLTDDAIRAIKRDNRVQTAIAADYGVNRSLISMIKSGKRWGHVV